MLPQIRQIQRFVVEPHVEHWESVGLDSVENGIGREALVDDVAGCDDSNVWEYLQTGHLRMG